MSSPSKGRLLNPLLLDEEGNVASLLGNEAIVRGALEMGVGFASGYPGTPSSEITDSLGKVSGDRGIVFEYSINEKIAVEMAFAASLAGARSITAMKHLGLMYAGDPISTMPYVGAVGGLVIVSAGDPSCRTSPNEQDQRHLAPMLRIPLLDPSSPQEALEMSRFAFRLSEESQLPVIMRPTTRVCHSRGPVHMGRLQEARVTGFKRDPKRFNPIPINARRLRLELEDRLVKAEELLAATDFVRQSGSGPLGVISCGAAASTTADLLLDRGLDQAVSHLRVGVLFPLLEQKLLTFLRSVEKVLIVEELSPYLEDAVAALCCRNGLRIEILGKRSGHLPLPFEYEPRIIEGALHEALGVGAAPAPLPETPAVVGRPPLLCPGCAHRAGFFAARSVFGPDRLFFNDIGCYTLGGGPPLDSADALLCMGAGVSLAAGVSRVTGERTVGFIGDSTFFHSGLPALVNAYKEEAEVVIVVLDNQVTAMTGFQESPGVEVTSERGPERHIPIEGAVRGLGVTQVVTVDPADLLAAQAALEEARDASGVSVVIFEHPCVNFLARSCGQAKDPVKFHIDHERCRTCGRQGCGHRCNVPIQKGLMRHMTRGATLRGADASASTPEQSPCTGRCPLFHCIQGYVGHIAGGEFDAALELILDRNPLPETVCRVCHRPCEDACVRVGTDAPVAINDLKRFVMDWARKQDPADLPAGPAPGQDNGKSVAVVGAGPSGLSAAHALRQRGFAVTLLDRNVEPGGMLLMGIPRYRLPLGALRRDVERVLSMGVEFRGEAALGKDFTLDDLLLDHDAVYLATGALAGASLDLFGEEEPGAPQVLDGLTYLEAVNLGRPVETGERVVVVGGGNAAMDAARNALRQGAKEVTIAYRRRREEMPAIAHELAAAEAEGILLKTQLQPLAVATGDARGLCCVRTEPGEPDKSGRQRPVAVKGSEVVLPADQIIAAIGQTPEWPEMTVAGEKIKRRADGSIRVDPETGATSHPQVFAGGDAIWGERTVTMAMGMGQRAAYSMDVALRGAEAASEVAPPPIPGDGADDYRISGFPRAERLHPGELDPAERSHAGAFDEVASAFTEEQARAEAARCLSCGMCGNCQSCVDLFGCPAFYLEERQVHIDPALCNGCGTCADLCPNDAIIPMEPAEEL